MDKVLDLPNLHLPSCCADPHVVLQEDIDYVEKLLQCYNCKTTLIVEYRDNDYVVFNRWESMIMERNRKKFNIQEVGIDLYPYPSAMY